MSEARTTHVNATRTPAALRTNTQRRFALLLTSMILISAASLPGARQSAFAEGAATPTVEAGSMHTCRLLVTGGVQCWGWNFNGQIGDATNVDRSVPVSVMGLQSGVTAISAGYYHTCALLDSGAVRCWGRDFDGELGDGANLGRTVPVEVRGLVSRVTGIAAGDNHTCAVLQTGTVWCWGANNYGQLGNGSNVASNLPVQVSGLAAGARSVSAGEGFSCAVLTNGGIKCWGRNI